MGRAHSRREFLKRSSGLLSAVGALGASARAARAAGPALLPRRPLGRTGLQVSALAFGCGRFFQSLPDGAWEPLIDRALALGVNYFDEAAGYNFDQSRPHSEVRIGQILQSRRRDLHVCSKIDARDPEKAKAELDGILGRLRTDYLDVLMVHSVRADETDPAVMDRGIYAQLRRWKDQGVARHIGFSTMMTDGALIRRYVEALDPEVICLAMNATKLGDIAARVLPAARERRVGVFAMKMLRDLVGQSAASPDELVAYGWQPGVSALLVGHSSVAELEANARLVARLASGAQTPSGARTERKVAHLATPDALSWARPGYRDHGARPA